MCESVLRACGGVSGVCSVCVRGGTVLRVDVGCEGVLRGVGCSRVAVRT